MRRHHLLRSASGCILSLALFACANRTDDATDTVLDSLAKRFACMPKSLDIVASKDSLTNEQRCALVAAAFRKIAEQTDGELQRSDTSVITSARVTSFAFIDTAGRGAEAYWAVDFVLSNRPYDAFVRVDQRTGAVTAAKAHKKF